MIGFDYGRLYSDPQRDEDGCGPLNTVLFPHYFSMVQHSPALMILRGGCVDSANKDN